MEHDLGLAGKNAIITGSSRGIGRAVVETLAAYGCNVWACARTASPEWEAWLQELSAAHGVWVRSVLFTLGDEASVNAGLQEIFAARENIDILINNAGCTAVGLVMETGLATLREVFEVNFFAQVHLTQRVVKRMLRNRSGAIVNMASAQALSPESGRLAYASSKAALALATRVMAKEFAPFGIRVNAVAPGAVQTDLLKNYPAPGLEKYVSGSLAGRTAQPAEIAAAVAFLASDAASFINGQILPVDGGRI